MRKYYKYFRFYKGFLVSGGVLLGAVLLSLFITLPLAQRTSSLFQETNTLSNEIKVLRQKDQLLQSVDETTLQNELASLVAAIPLDKSLPTIFTTLDGLTGKTGVAIDDVALASPGTISTPSAVQAGRGPNNEVGFSASVKGSADQVLAFTETVHAIRRLFTIKAMDLGVNQNGTINITVGMTGYYLPLKKGSSSESQFSLLSQKEETLLRSVMSFPLLSEASTSAGTPIEPLFIGKEDPFSL